MTPRLRRGFTLIEILVVVVLILGLATIAVVNLKRARITAEEELALQTIRHITKAVSMFVLTNAAYPTDLTLLGRPNAEPPYLEADLIGNGTVVDKRGYAFLYDTQGPDRFTLNANPQVPGSTGIRHFYTDQTGFIRFDPDGPASAADPVIP